MKGRTIAARALAYAGAPLFLRTANRVRRRPGQGLVLVYHRISTEPDYLGLCVSPRNFDHQLAQLQRYARVLPLDEFVKHISSPKALAGDIAAITFDDGYRDNLDAAMPILARHRLPATVFVTTDFIDGHRRPVGERLQDAFVSLWRRRIRPDLWIGIGDHKTDRLVRSVLARPGSLALLRKLAFSLARLQWERAEALVEVLEQLAGFPSTTSSRMLDWKGVRELARNGIEIGSHTLCHPILSRISRERAEHEVLASKQRIEKEIGREVQGFAFPNGRAVDFTEADLRFLQQVSYTYATTTQRGVNLNCTNPYRIRRIGVGNYAGALFDFKLALGR